MRKAYSYIRMSTDIQLKGDSLRRQLDASKEYASANNLELIDTIDGNPLRDIGVSGFRGKNSQNGVLFLFLQKLEANEIEPNSVLLIESLDRLSRDDVLNALAQFLRILELGIEIVTLTDNQKYTKESLNTNIGALYMSLGIMFRANEESEIKSKRIRAAWKTKRENALIKPLTSIAPAWLKHVKDENRFEVIQDRAETVKKIFELCTSTCGLWAITKYLNANQTEVFGRSKYWNKSYIRKILSNRSVLGEYQPNSIIDGKRTPCGDPVIDYYPRIISEEQFILANAAIEKRAVHGKGRKGVSFSNLFSGLVFCGICGSKMVLRNRGSTPKGGKHLICNNKLVSAGCTMPEWKLPVLESEIFKHVKEIDFSELIGNQSQSTEIQNKITLLHSQLKTEETELEKLMTLTMEETLNESTKLRYIEKLNDCENKLKSIKLEISNQEKELTKLTEQSYLLKSNELKEMVKKISENSENYFFRSSLNQLLGKTIERIDLKIESAQYQPWEIERNDQTVRDFLTNYPSFVETPFDELIDKNEFKAFCKAYENRITIKYKSGAIRHIFVGSRMSLLIGGYKNTLYD